MPSSRFRSASLTGQLGAQSFAGATAVLATVREAAPIAAALIIAGAAGSAICADLGARKIREEIDAMEVLGINPVARLVVPRALATLTVAVLMNGIVIAAGIVGGYFFTVIIQGGSAGAFLSSFTALATLPDIYVSMVKAAVFGFLAAIIGAYKGLNAGGGPSGVGQAVNESVIVAFMLLFLLNAIISALYFQFVPQAGSVMATLGRPRPLFRRSRAEQAVEIVGRPVRLLHQGAGAGRPRADQGFQGRGLQDPRRGGVRHAARSP